MRRPVRVAILLALPVLALLIVCAVVELALTVHQSRAVAKATRATFYSWSVYTSDGMHLGGGSGPLQLVLKPFVLFGNRPNQDTPQFTVDGMGFRDARRRGTDRPRIIVIGGSAAFGTGLASDDETLAHQLGLLTGVDVINAAVIGYQSGVELVDLLTRLVDLKPSLVVALDGWNDYRYRSHLIELERHLKQLHRFTDASLLVRASSIPLVLFPRTGRWLGERLDLVLAPGRANAALADDPQGSAAEYAKNVVKMHKLGAAFGFRFLCLIQPERSSERTAYAAFRQRAAHLLTENGIRYLDLNEETYRRRLPDARFMDPVHLDAAGNRIVAEIAAEEIRRTGLLP